MKKTIALFIALCVLLPACALGEKYEALPPLQRMTQALTHTRLGGGLYMDAAALVTAHEGVNAEMAALMTDMAERGQAALPSRPDNPQEGSGLMVGSTVYRTGEKWMSFLTVANVIDARRQIYVDFDARAYDMETGARLSLADVIADEAGWQQLSEEARAQLSAYYPGEEADPERLAALCSREMLADAGFTLSVAFLQLHFRADALYPDKQTLMHVRVPYAALAGHLTAAAAVQTDNSGYKLVALTYDDGPVRLRTQALLSNLRAGGAGATFFIVGSRIVIGRDLLCYAQDTGFSLASHTYDHRYKWQNSGIVVSSRDRLNAELSAVTGTKARIMRAPGGDERVFIEEQVGMPLIHWSLVSHSDGGLVPNPHGEARRLAAICQDGDIVLLHDLYGGTEEMAAFLPQLLAERGFLCVTVEELFAARGIPLEPDTVYYHAREEKETGDR